MLTALSLLTVGFAPPKIVGDWTSKTLHYTFNAKGEYLALFYEMDHQGTYRIEGRRVILTPTVVAQRPTARFLKELKGPDSDPIDAKLMRTLAKPYALDVGADGRTLVGPGIRLAWTPKAGALFEASTKRPKKG